MSRRKGNWHQLSLTLLPAEVVNRRLESSPGEDEKSQTMYTHAPKDIYYMRYLENQRINEMRSSPIDRRISSISKLPILPDRPPP